MGRKADGSGYCKRPPGWGTPSPGHGRCKRHGGSTPLAQRGAQIAEAAKQVEKYGLSIEVDPHTALIEELERTAGHVAWLRIKVDEVANRGNGDSELVGPVGTEGPTETGAYSHPSIEPNIWLKLYMEERKHLIKIATSCIAAGIEERRVQLAEQQGELMARVIKGILEDLGVADDPKAGKVVRKHLTLIQGEAA